QEADEDLQSRCLACPDRTDQANDLSRERIEEEALQGGLSVVRFPKLLDVNGLSHYREPCRGPGAYESSGQIPRSGRDVHPAPSDAQFESVNRLPSHESLSDQCTQAICLRL